ncbi:hypothetical protein Bbelb_056850 [Branchiostoma belcheri]|nr:hypothetical protein Bbelb_056850 [Branchiostoma belcheri]
MHVQQESSPRKRKRSSQSTHKPTHPPRIPQDSSEYDWLQAGKNNTRCTDNDTDFSDFVGIERNRVQRKRFFLGYMKKNDPKKLQQTIYKYAQHKGVQLSFVRLMPTKKRDLYFARINVLLHQTHKVMEENFWPHGVTCREWLSERKYKSRDNGDTDKEGESQVPNTQENSHT